MYGYEWTGQNGIYRLSVNSKIEKEIRPVFKEELDYFGFNEHWTYPDTDAPLLWAEGIRRYILNGTCVAEATGGGFYTKPTIKIYTEGLNLEPIDVDALWKENERLMLGLEKTSMDFIRKTHDKYEKQGMAFAVAFSGGKDSLVLLDLVSRTLSPDEVSVVFSNFRLLKTVRFTSERIDASTAAIVLNLRMGRAAWQQSLFPSLEGKTVFIVTPRPSDPPTSTASLSMAYCAALRARMLSKGGLFWQKLSQLLPRKRVCCQTR